MRYLYSLGLFGGILLISGACLRAAEVPGTFTVGSYRGPTGDTYASDSENPKEKLGIITGTIKSIDRISGSLWIQDAKGIPVKFTVETNTQVDDHHLQIGLDDLLVGDRVTVSYDVDPRLVNRIDRI